MSDERSILSRWSARKRAAATEKTDPDAVAPPQDDPADDAALEAERLANREAAEAIDLDSLDRDSDLSVFLRDGVPDLLRRTALQKVWRSSPVFANLDALVDYGEDYGRRDLIMETFTSAWQAGRGYAEEAFERDPTAPEDDTAGEPPEPAQAAEGAPPPSDAVDDAPETLPEEPDPEQPDTVVAHAPDPAEAAEPKSPVRGSLRARLTGGA